MELTVNSLNAKGQGVSAAGDPIPRVLPGETVYLAENGAPRIIKPSADRVTAQCRNYKSCGGCALMHASDNFVAEWKSNVVAHALKAQGLETEIKTISTSPPNSRRRAKLSGTRTKKGALVGLHGRASHTIVGIEGCQLLSPELMAALPALEELTILAASRKSEVQLTVTKSKNGPDIHVETAKPVTNELRVQLANLAQSQKIARLSWNDEMIVELLPPYQTFGTAEIKVPAGVFLQATEDGESTLVESVNEIVGDAKRVVDLFAGCGTFALPLAQSAEVHAVEGEGAMLSALEVAWRQTAGLKKVSTETRDLFRRPLEADELDKFNCAVIDPPRAGAKAQIQTLTQSKIAKIAMVSCNPITFARDAKTLVEGGFDLEWVKPVDQFRWSSHVELIGKFTRL